MLETITLGILVFNKKYCKSVVNLNLKCYNINITKFNMSARYDDYKKEFQNKYTDDYTLEQIQNIEEVRLWLKSLLKTE